MTDTRIKLIKLLRKNARATSAELSGVLGIPSKKIDQEIEAMEKDGTLLGFTCIINESRTSDSFVRALIEIQINPEKDKGFDHIAKKIFEFPNVIDHYLISGSYDFLVIVTGTNLQEISAFVFDNLATIDQVTSTKTHFIMKNYKQNGIVLPETLIPSILPVSP